MKNKLIKLFSINSLLSLLNFMSTILTLNIFSLNIFGNFVLISTYIRLVNIIYNIFPANYAVVKLQDNREFISPLFFSYIIGFIITIPIIFGIYFYIDNIEISIMLLLIYSLGLGMNLLSGVLSQAFNYLDKFYFMLLIGAFLKLFSLGLIYLSTKYANLNGLFIVNIISVGFPSFFLLVQFISQNNFKYSFSLTQICKILYNEFTIIKKYYINTIIKSIKDSSFVLFLSIISSAENIGLFSLFSKISGFVLGNLRIIETYFINRDNNQNIYNIYRYKIFISFFAQLLIIFVGIFYLKLSIDKYYIHELFIISFLSYPYLEMIFIRNRFLLLYELDYLNYSLLIYIFFIFIALVVLKFLSIMLSIADILLLFVILEVIQMSYLYYINKNIIKKEII